MNRAILTVTDAQMKSAEMEVPRLVQLLELKPGMTIADVGAGFGAWTMRFATWIGSEGRVYVVQQEVGAALTHVRTISAWSPDSQSASLFLVLFRKP